MLTLLKVKNLAVIEEAEIELGPGFTVLTGETGAGKSVLVGALGLLLGERATPDIIRTGEREATIEGVFDLEGSGREAPEAFGGGAELVIRRSVSADGRSRAFINGSAANLSALSAVTGSELDISSQHAHQALSREEFHLGTLDAHAGDGAAIGKFEAARKDAQAVLDELVDLKRSASDRASREEFAVFQLKELDALAPAEGEDESLSSEKAVLSNAGRISDAVRGAEELIYGREGSGYGLARRAALKLSEVSGLDPALAESSQMIEQAVINLDEAASALRNYLAKTDFSPERLEEVECRLAEIRRLVRKHAGPSGTLGDLIKKHAELRSELQKLRTGADRIPELEGKALAAAESVVSAGKALSGARRKAAASLARDVTGVLAGLSMPDARFLVDLKTDQPDPAALVSGSRRIPEGGFDTVRFLFSANQGEDPRPFSKIASGGELSRTMLAVKSVLAVRDPVPLYIFDEVDSGIGGATAEIVGSHLKSISKHRQVICITHLPQVAALGDTHLLVTKTESGGRTFVSVRQLDRDGRVGEIARMLGGVKVTETAVSHAREMIAGGERRR